MRFVRTLALLLTPLLVAAGPLQAPEHETKEAAAVRARDNDPRPTDHKYFHEPGHDDTLGHYDSRYFKGVVSYDNRTETLHHMIRAYLNTFREKGLETWISHGTLLGWWWNGRILPWDWDLDVQVSGSTLDYIGKTYNRTFHHYESDDRTFKRDYLLDVNPWIWQRERGDGQNIIDARWIDTTTGLYIDITGLSETHPDTRPGIWVCKNYHRYHIKSLFPMRDSMFEGVPAKIPYAYDDILLKEYTHRALVTTEYHGHRWDVQKKLWTQIPKSKKIEKARPHVPRSFVPRSTNFARNFIRLITWS